MYGVRVCATSALYIWIKNCEMCEREGHVDRYKKECSVKSISHLWITLFVMVAFLVGFVGGRDMRMKKSLIDSIGTSFEHGDEGNAVSDVISE